VNVCEKPNLGATEFIDSVGILTFTIVSVLLEIKLSTIQQQLHKCIAGVGLEKNLY
jgi:hypothetical protein